VDDGRKFGELARITVPQAEHDALDLGEFLRALHLRVGGEDLLDERGSGPWEPDNEHPIRVRRADAGAARSSASR
jgi:hypothetical protein